MASEGCRPETLRPILSDSLPLSVTQCYRCSSYRLIGFRALIFLRYRGRAKSAKKFVVRIGSASAAGIASARVLKKLIAQEN